ncbi:hypothetical protein V1L52_10145 [Treponema sp. HNW]|uniref:hypothetical protein n=1 Tax=Treponema sp. HNW TaxID=3116654 RepID=UPI003D0CE08E
MSKLTKTQEGIITLFNHPYFTVDLIENWLNGKTGEAKTKAMAVQFSSIKGFYEAVTAFEKVKQDYNYKILARGICIACGQIMEEDMNNAIDTVISILESAGIDRAEAERCGVNEGDLQRLEEAFCKMEEQK